MNQRSRVLPGAVDLASGSLRLRFDPDSEGRYRFVTEIVDGGHVLEAASVPNVPVAGGLDLAADAVIRDGDGLRLSGVGYRRDPDGGRVGFAWNGSVRPCPGDGFAFAVSVELEGSLADPPAIELWLGPLSTIAHRQTYSFRRTFVSGPVRNTLGLPGNSVPAAYLYDPRTGVETMLHVDAEAMAWAPGRLLVTDLREILEHGTTPRYGLGLVPSERFTVPAGRHEFRWRLWQRHVGSAPDSWEASARLVDTLAEGFAGTGRSLGGGLDWGDVATAALGDLLDADQSQVVLTIDGEEVLGLRAYARDAIHYYDHAPDHFELMAVADVVAPLILYLRLHPDPGGHRLAERLRAALARFHRPEASYISNRFPTDGIEPIAETWYFFLNGLIKIPWVALIETDETLAQIALDGLHGAERLADATADRLPVYADFRPTDGPRTLAATPNPSVAGLLAYAALMASELDGIGRASLARRLLVGLRHEPVGLAYHEPLQLGFAAAAAGRLADGHEPGMAVLAEEFVRAQLRMMYWDEDPQAERGGYRVRGMFEGCASILYPAFKENIEAILPWVVLLRSGRGPTALLLQVMNLIRLHSFAYFEPLLPRPEGGAAPWIPYENIGTTELPDTGAIGKEIYGTGEVFWAHLLFDGLGRADDSEILVVYTDLLEPHVLRHFPPARRRFIIYNPTSEDRTFRFAVSALAGDYYRVSVVSDSVSRDELAAGIPIRLTAGTWLTIDVDEVPG